MICDHADFYLGTGPDARWLGSGRRRPRSSPGTAFAACQSRSRRPCHRCRRPTSPHGGEVAPSPWSAPRSSCSARRLARSPDLNRTAIAHAHPRPAGPWPRTEPLRVARGRAVRLRARRGRRRLPRRRRPIRRGQQPRARPPTAGLGRIRHREGRHRPPHPPAAPVASALATRPKGSSWVSPDRSSSPAPRYR